MSIQGPDGQQKIGRWRQMVNDHLSWERWDVGAERTQDVECTHLQWLFVWPFASSHRSAMCLRVPDTQQIHWPRLHKATLKWHFQRREEETLLTLFPLIINLPFLLGILISQKMYTADVIFWFSHSVMSDSATAWTASHQASLSITNSQSLLKLMSIKSMMTFQPSHPLSSLLPAFNLSQHQGLFKWVSSSHQVAKVLEFQLQHQSFQWIFRTNFL